MQHAGRDFNSILLEMDENEINETSGQTPITERFGASKDGSSRRRAHPYAVAGSAELIRHKFEFAPVKVMTADEYAKL